MQNPVVSDIAQGRRETGQRRETRRATGTALNTAPFAFYIRKSYLSHYIIKKQSHKAL